MTAKQTTIAKKSTSKSMSKKVTICKPVSLPSDKLEEAAKIAIEVNPANRPTMMGFVAFGATFISSVPIPGRLAVLTAKRWRTDGVKLGVGFTEQGTNAFKNKVIAHLNAWGETGNVLFSLSSSPEVRITTQQEGYWSYLGTDILLISKNEPTMCLERFNANTSESEYIRVVRHEGGHTLGFPHEHLRRAIINRLDYNKTISWGNRVLGWDRQTVIQQILTPLEEASIMGTTIADEESIMTYQLPGSITKDGRPIIGGVDINSNDKRFIGELYPKEVVPPPPPPPPPTGDLWEIKADAFYSKLTSKTKPTVTELAE